MNMFAKRLGRGGATSYEEVLKVCCAALCCAVLRLLQERRATPQQACQQQLRVQVPEVAQR